MRRSLLACIGAATALSPAARAQDALRSAVSLAPVIQQSQTAPVDLSPERPHLGPVQLALGAYAGLEFNDNVNTSQFDAQSDLLLRGGLDLGFLWPATERSQLNFSSTIGYVHYLKNTQYDHLEVAPNSALSWAIGFDDGTITFFDQFSYSQQVLAYSALSGLATFPRFNNTIGTRVDWLTDRWAFQFGYSHNDSASDSAQFQYLNSSSEYFSGRGAWRFAENTQVGLEASSSLTSYQSSSQNNNVSFSLGPYAEWHITHDLRATLRAGAALYFFDSPPITGQSSDLTSYYFGVDINHQLTSFFSHHLSVQRDVRQGLNLGSSYIQELNATYSASFALTQKISLGASVSYVQGNQPFEVPVTIFPFGTFILLETENYDRYSGALTASWQATQKITASLSYSHWTRQSNVVGNNYAVNSLSATLSYNF